MNDIAEANPRFAKIQWFGAAVLALLLLISFSRELLAIRKWIWFELQSPFGQDRPVYWALGRGVCNGLTPYVDLFDFSLPGIIYVNGLSFCLTDSAWLSNALQVAVVLVFAVLPALAISLGTKTLPILARLLLTLLALSFGASLSLYLGLRAGGGQSESFAAVFVSAYAVLLFTWKSPDGLLRLSLLSLCLFGAIGFKEPAVLTACAIALLAGPSLRGFLRDFVLPCAVVGLSAVAVMFVLGFLREFIELYLQGIFSLLTSGPKGHSTRFMATLSFSDLQYKHFLRDMRSFSYCLVAVHAVLIGTIVYWSVRAKVERPTKYLHLFQFTAACALIYCSVQMGMVVYGHHMGLAIPGYLGLFLLCMRYLTKSWGAPSAVCVFVVLTILVFGSSFRTSTEDYRLRISDMDARRAPVISAAAEIDKLVAACGLEGYAYIGSLPRGPILPGFTRHSPSGAIFFQLRHFLNGRAPLIRRRFFEDLRKSDIVVVDTLTATDEFLGTAHSRIEEVLAASFTTAPWQCSEDTIDAQALNYFQVYYRLR